MSAHHDASRPDVHGHDGHSHSHDGHAHGHDRDHAHDHGADEDFARMIELDTIVHSGFLADVTTWIQSLAADLDVRHILDVGAGTGAGTLALAQRFPAAQVVAADVSPAMLTRVQDLAATQGLAGRISTERVDIAADVSGLGTFDLAWASASLHEASDPDQAFRNLHSALRPGALLAVIEMDDPPRMLPTDLADFEDRLHAATAHVRQGKAYSPDWTGPLARAGFELEARRTFTTDQSADGRGPAGEFATLFLSRVANVSSAHLSRPDQDLLTTLLGDGPGSLRQRSDLQIRGTRSAWIARRP